jgi:cytochrome c5
MIRARAPGRLFTVFTERGAERLYCAADRRVRGGNTVSQQDTHFFNVFSLVIGLLVAIAIGIFALARIVASHTQDLQVLTEADYARSVAARLAPMSQEAVAGQDNSALAIKPATTQAAAGSAAPEGVPKNGQEVFQQVCSTCHGQGIAGAPKAGDKAAWAPRIAEGKATLYEHALHGYSGGPGGGVMPPKGGRTDLSDELIKQGVDYMVKMAQ